MNIFELIQLFSGGIFVWSYIPQIIQVHKTRRSEDLNLKFLTLLVVGLLLTTIYSVYLVAAKGTGIPLLITSISTTTLAAWLTIIAKRYKNNGNKNRTTDKTKN